MDTLDNLINELESEVHTAKKATFSSDILLDKAKLLELVSRMRNSLPYIITEARQIKENEEEQNLLLSTFEDEKDQIIKEKKQIIEEKKNKA